MSRKTCVLAAILLALLLPVLVHKPADAAHQRPVTSRVATSATGLLYLFTFDTGPNGAIADSSGQVTLHRVEKDGALTFVGHDNGWAINFPPRCEVGRVSCPRAILESPRLERLNPGWQHLRFGASVLMTTDNIKRGQNIVQKGYSTHGSQFKLQIDGKRGRPSCVIAAFGLIHRITADASVSDGQWHNVECERLGSSLKVVVDGIVHGQVSLPLTLAVANKAPLRIGGKHTRADNDQFSGVLDNVYVAIG